MNEILYHWPVTGINKIASFYAYSLLTKKLIFAVL